MTIHDHYNLQRDNTARKTIVALICVMIAYGCGQDSAVIMTENEKSIVVEEVRSRVLEYIDAWKMLDTDRMLDFFSNEGSFVVAGDGTLMASYDEYTTQMTGTISDTKELNYVEIRDSLVNLLTIHYPMSENLSVRFL